MSRSGGQPGYRVRYRPGEVRSSKRGRRIRGFQEFFVGVTRAAYWIGLCALLAYAVYQSWYLFTKTGYLKLEQVEIVGNRVLSQQDIMSLSRIQLGSHFFRYQPEAIRALIVAHPRIRDAKVDQVSPKMMRIEVEENQPSARTVIEGKLYEVGQDGRLLGESVTPVTTLPLLLGLPEEKPDEQGTRRVARDLFTQVPAWIATLKSSFLSDFEALDFRNPFRVEVRWRNMQIFVGEPSDVKEMATQVQATLADAEKRHVNIATMDLRFHMLVVKYGSAAATAVATWAVPVAETVPLAVAPTVVSSVPATAVATTVVGVAPVKSVPLTEHPSVKAAAIAPTQSSSSEAITSASAMWDENELRALNETAPTTAATTPVEAKPAFRSRDEEGESDEAPDPAYIYDPNSVRRHPTRRRDDEVELAPAEDHAPDYRVRGRRARPAQEPDDGN